MLTQEQIMRILEEVTSDKRVQTVLLCGSYAYGKPTDESDLDIRCITNDGSDWPEIRKQFGTTIEIFFNSREKVLSYFDEDQQSNEADCISAWDQGIIYYDPNSVGLGLKNKAKEIFNKGPYNGMWKKSTKHNI